MANDRDPWGKPEWDARKRAAAQIATDKAVGKKVLAERAAKRAAANDVKSHRKKK